MALMAKLGSNVNNSKLLIYQSDVVSLKVCNKCNSLKSLDSFCKDRTKKDGLHTVCKSCKYFTDKAYRERNKDRIRKRQKQWEKENREHCNARRRELDANNKERRRELVNASRRKKLWYYAAKEAQRRAHKLQATPTWADLESIQEIYETCPEGHHVDHIVPLRGKTVCGLHVEHNLQHLPALENIIKSNKF